MDDPLVALALVLAALSVATSTAVLVAAAIRSEGIADLRDRVRQLELLTEPLIESPEDPPP